MPAIREQPAAPAPVRKTAPPAARRRHTLASRLAFLTICVAIVLTTLAYGTVHAWALTIFSLSAIGLVLLWLVDAVTLRSLLVPANPLQWPLVGMLLLGFFQLLPLRTHDSAGLPLSPVRSLSLDPYATRLVIIQVAALVIFFAATSVFVDTPRRLRTLVRTITIFGFLLAVFGLTQSFTSAPDRVYWFRELAQSTAFGPFINRHHFAGFMELAVAIPFALLLSGAVENYKRPLYAFAAVVMSMALVATNSRGGIISLGAEIFVLFVTASFTWGRKKKREESRPKRVRAAALRGLIGVGVVVLLIGGAILLSGPEVFTRFLGTPLAEDPTTGRAHFWRVTLDVIRAYPFTGSGLGAFGTIYTRYDTRNGSYRLEQAHNDYLQVLSDAGIIGAILGLAFIFILFRRAFNRRETHDRFRRAVTTGAMAGCFASLVHSFFDFPLHTTANALLFLILAAIATQDTRINTTYQPGRKRRKRAPGSTQVPASPPGDGTGLTATAEL